ncbi:NACHT, LRR and PYD domains-containing protein 12-like [Erythrolamprus reginae]|uniref:NACHT, LRR and PYD domains-containing protein 12-like n=1 Tax=Erythrolamprus reginae TaxID=121349 RepID=UPI00396C5804
MSNTMKENIYNALNELIEKQFKDFKWRLNSINYDGRPNIPMASLDKADLQEVVELLSQYYGEDALEVCTDVLKKCNRNDLAKNLEENKDVDAHQLPILSEYRNYIKQKFAMIKDPNAIPGEYVPLNQRYSKLIILDYHQSEEEKEDEILAMGRKHLEIINKRAETSTSIETLFNPDKYGLTPQIVVLQGAAGIGKTMMAKKIIFDWASQQLYQNKFNYVFYISCSEMNFHAESQKTSIAEIISNEWLKCQKVKNVIQNILRNEEKLLFIIDGFDELRHSFNQAENYCCIDPWKKEPVRIILSNLFQKRILPKSSLIITTRPTALEKLYQCLEHPRCFEILGFSTKEREEYFLNFFENKDQAMQAFRFVKQNDTLFTMCVIPLVSWIICTVMKQELERGKDLQKTPYTLTAIYMLYFSSLLKFHHKESKQDLQANVKGLCSLAAEGVWKRKILFMEKEVKKHGLDQKDYIPLFLNQSVFERDIDYIQTYSFIHLSFQEFFAALFYVLEEGDEQHSENWKKNLQTLLETHRSFRPDFVVGFHFLFGFLNEEKRMRELRKEFGWEISPKNKEFLLNWVKSNIPKRRHNFQLQKEMFSYLYETRDDNFIKNAVCSITEIDYQSNSDMELMILAYCIQHCQNLKYLFAKGSAFVDHAETELFLPEDKCIFDSHLNFPATAWPIRSREWNLDERYKEDFFKALTKLRNIRELRLNGWSFTESCSRQLAEVFKKNQRLKMLHLAPKDIDDRAAELLCEGLQHVDCKVETLVLSEEILTESCSRHLVEVLRKNQRLRELTLYLKNPDDKIMEVLCDGLKQPECTIETLKLSGEILTESCSRNLAEVLRKNQSFRELTLFLRNLDDKIMEVLCDGLKKPECTIETLKLTEGVITKSGSRHLAEVIRKKQRLKTLYLYVNNDDNEAMEVLCEGLKHPECTVKTLELDGEILTESCSRNLAEVLRKNQSLRELTLFVKNLDDKIMEVLCDGLKQAECTIEMLKLNEGVITKSGSRHLAEVIRKKQRLKTLYLYLHNEDNEAMEVLCEGLKHPECTVKTLRLGGKILTESCSRNLAEVLRKNQSLRELTLYLKNLDDKIMEVLCDGLKKPECTIETLNLTEGVITKSGSRHLAEVIRKKQRLKTLYLYLNNEDNEAMEVLCEGLKHPECTVKTLELAGEILTESCSRNLAEVLRKNQSFRELTLFLRNLDDKIMEVLCDGLKKPECTIETLKLTEGVITKSGSRHLAEVIRKKQRLKTLYLYVNNDDNEAMEVLCEGLKHPECTVKTLQLDGEILTESCSRNLAEVLRKNQSLRELTLYLKNLDDKIMEVLCDGLKQAECTIEMLNLTEGVITKSGSRHLAEVIRKKQRLKTLHLYLNNEDNEAMEVLCEGLKHPECTVKTLRLGGKILTESCSRNLAEVLRKNQSLRELTLYLKNLDDKIMEVLYDGLKKPECTIETLNLTEGVITKSGSRHLAEVIRKKQGLKTLYLYLNNEDNEAMEVLCEGLKHPECTVKTLELGGEILTESCSRNLAEVLRKNQSLRELTLFLKNLDDKIMEVLCDGLKKPECTIETLNLTEGVITKSGSRHLAEVIRKKQGLKTLYLYLNNEDNEAMEVLCEGLKHPECTVKTLELGGEILTESCSRNLAEVLRKNQSFRELTLFLRNLDDNIMEVLCDGLKKPECTIETLKLTEGVITKSGSRHLAEVIRKKQRLKTLYLYVNSDDNEAMEVLCEGLKHPECTVKTLQLGGEILTESCSRNLAEVLRKNQSLRELTLFVKNLDDKIMEVLCDGLKQAECTIETLKLNGKIYCMIRKTDGHESHC